MQATVEDTQMHVPAERKEKMTCESSEWDETLIHTTPVSESWDSWWHDTKVIDNQSNPKSVKRCKHVLQSNAVIKMNRWELLLPKACSPSSRRFLWYNYNPAEVLILSAMCWRCQMIKLKRKSLQLTEKENLSLSFKHIKESSYLNRLYKW